MKTTRIRSTILAGAILCAISTAKADPVPVRIVPNPIQELVAKHYSAYGIGADPSAIFPQTTAEDWQNCGSNGADCQTREQLAGMLKDLQRAIPDMKWEVLEIMASGDKMVVRGQGSGTPAGAFMGIPHTGNKFRIMSIDIHTIEKNKIRHTYHLEDWATALRQLNAK